MPTSELDQDEAERFSECMIGPAKDGALALMISIGHRTSLFDAMAELPPPPASSSLG